MSFEIENHEALSIIVKEIFKQYSTIMCNNDTDIVIAYTFENAEDLKPIWDLAVNVACMVAPWLKQEWDETPGWTMNLFTQNGLLEFPTVRKQSGETATTT